MSLLKNLSLKFKDAFEQIGVDSSLVIVTTSDRPDLSDYQCNGAMKAAGILKSNPREIAGRIKTILDNDIDFSEVRVDGPGFINVRLSDKYIASQLDGLNSKNISSKEAQQEIIIDYGGPNVAKPLHVGHLRSAVIGEAIKRTARYLGHNVISDIHLGDWGTPMGMLIAELQERHPTWPYFSEDITDFPKESPLTVHDLMELYPQAATHFKEDIAFQEKARKATADLQQGNIGYRALWNHFIKTSITEVKEDFAALNVSFDLWLGESDTNDSVEPMIKELTKRGIATKSQGAVVINVADSEDSYEVPPLILMKQDGGIMYGTTDLATIIQRIKDYKPDHIIYVVDQRQSLHFTQVFRAAEKSGYIDSDRLEHAGFGTVNGPNGKPFKTREGGIMRLRDLIELAKTEVIKTIGFPDDHELTDDEAEMVNKIAIAAIKFGDLSSNRQSDYIFQPTEFVKMEGKTGPYIQYAAVRIKSVLEKAKDQDIEYNDKAELIFNEPAERALALKLLEFPTVLQNSFEARMPHIACEHVFSVAQAFSSFYQSCPILTPLDSSLIQSRLRLSSMAFKQIEVALDNLGIEIPNKMLRFE